MNTPLPIPLSSWISDAKPYQGPLIGAMIDAIKNGERPVVSCRPPTRKFPTIFELKDLIGDSRVMVDPELSLYQTFKTIAAKLEGKGIPAADLSDEQKCALYTMAGLMKYENGRMVSIAPVAITDRPGGGYIIGCKANP